MIRIVQFGFPDRELVTLDDSTVLQASSETARATVERMLKLPVRAGVLAEATTLLQPGDPGHIQAVLDSLPDSYVTGGE